MAVDGGDGALPGDAVEPRRRVADGLGVAAVGEGDESLGDGVLGEPFDRCGVGDDGAFVGPVDEEEVGDLGFPFGEGAGLVHDDDVDVGRGLDGRRVLEEDAALGTESGADHDRGGGGEAEGVGAGDDDDGDGVEQRLGGVDVADQHPCGEREGAADERDEHEPERGPVREALAGGLGVLGFLDELDDLGEGGVGADAGGAGVEDAVAVDGGADDRRAGFLVDGEALAGDDGLVDLALAVGDQTVDGDLGAGADHEPVSDDDVTGGDLDRGAVAFDERHRRGEVQQGADGVVGAAAGAHLEPVAQQHERGEHGRGLVEDVSPTGERDRDGVRPAGADADRDEDHHVEGSGAQRGEGAGEEDRRRPEDDRQAQQELPDVVADPERDGQVQPEDVHPDVGVHRDDEREDEGDEEPVAHVGRHRRHRVAVAAVVVMPGVPARAGGALVHHGCCCPPAAMVGVVGVVGVVGPGGDRFAEVVGHRQTSAVVAAVAHPVTQIGDRRHVRVEGDRGRLRDGVGSDGHDAGPARQHRFDHVLLGGPAQPADLDGLDDGVSAHGCRLGAGGARSVGAGPSPRDIPRRR